MKQRKTKTEPIHNNIIYVCQIEIPYIQYEYTPRSITVYTFPRTQFLVNVGQLIKVNDSGICAKQSIDNWATSVCQIVR